MAEEYVYKIVIDDGDVNKTIDSIDRRVVDLTKRMDTMFKNVGAGAGDGAQRSAQQVEQAAGRVRRAEQQTVQQTVQGQRQVARARLDSLKSIDEEIKRSKGLVTASREAADAAKRRLEQTKQHLQSAIDERQREIDLVRQLKEEGGRTAPAAIEVSEMAQRGAERRIERFTPSVAEGEVAVTGAEQELEQATQAHEQLLQSRQQLTDQIVESAGQQSAGETQAAQEAVTAQTQAQEQIATATTQSTEARITAAREAVRSSAEVTNAKRQELASAERAVITTQNEADAASRSAQLKRRAAEDASESAKSAAEVQEKAAEDLVKAEEGGSEAAIKSAKEKKAAADEIAASKKQEADAAKAASSVATRASQDAAFAAKESKKERTTASKEVAAASKAEKTAQDTLGKSTKALAREQRATAKAERDTERAFIKTTKTFKQQRNDLDRLAQKHGSFTVTIGKSADEMNDLEKEVMDVVRADKKLGEEIDKLINKQGKFDVSVDRGTFAGGPQTGVARGQYRQAGFAAQRLGIPGAAAFGEAAAVGGAAGVAVAGILLTTQQLIKAFMSLAGAAKDAFQSIIVNSVEAAKEIEVARAQFSAFFQQDTQAAEAALGRLQQLSIQLGENVVGIGRAFLPEVEDLDQLEEVTKIAVALARFQPEQGILGARISLQEALAGEFRSLQRRFEISPVAVDKIREAFEAGGVTALLEELQGELERTGRSVEDLSDTFGVSVGHIRERWRQMSQQIGDPIIQQIKEELNGIDEELEKLTPDLSAVASGFGDIVAKMVEIVGTEIEEFLETFDPEPLFEVAEALYRVVDAFGIMLTGLNVGEGASSALESGLTSLGGALLAVEGFFLRTALSIAETREQMASLLPLIILINDATEFTVRNVPISPAGTVPGQGIAAGTVGLLGDVVEGFLETGSSVAEVEERIAGLNERTAEFTEGLQGYLDAFSDISDEGDKAANTFLKMTSGLDELTVLQKDYEEAQLKVNEAVNEFNIQAQLKFEKILTDAKRTRLDFEIESAQKTLDLERKNAQKVTDIRSKFDQDIIDASQDLTDKEADILRKHSRSVLDLEDDLNNKRIEEEQKYQDELERIRDRFNFQAFEAILANDGKRLRQIRRRQAFEEGQAKKNRDRGIRDIDKETDDRRKKLDLALEREIEDARIANARKIRDLAASLDQQLEKQAEARRRDLAAQALAERRKRADLTESLNRQLADYESWWNERNRVTQDKIKTDLDLMRDYVDTAAEILDELSTLGITFNPVTGQPEFSFSMPDIQPETPAIKEIRDLVVKLTEERERAAGGGVRDRDVIQTEVEALSIPDLIEAMGDLEESVDLATIFPGQDIFTILENLARPDDLAQQLLMDQALQIGQQGGMSQQAVLNETLGLSLDELAEWIDEFIAAHTLPVLPEFSIFGEMPADILAQPGGMSVPGALPFGAQPAPFSPLLTDAQLAGSIPFSSQVAPLQQPLVPGMAQFPTAADAGDVQGFFTVQGQDVPGAIAGQTPFFFPNVTDAPFVTPAEVDGVPQFTPSFAQGLGMAPGQIQGQFMPGGISPISPAAGFTVEEFQANLDEQVAAQVTAELMKRGEIQDTVAFAELMIEKQNLGLAALLDEQVEGFQVASDAELAILEDTIAKQQEALAKLREDPALEEEAKAVEEAIVILEEALQRQRDATAEANLAIIQEESSLLQSSEEEKQDAIGQTLDVAETSILQKKDAMLRGLTEETAGTIQAAQDQIDVVQGQETDEAEIRTEGRETELEADAEHTEARLEQQQDGFAGEADQLLDFWDRWMQLEDQGIRQDLRILQEWINLRQQYVQQAATLIPGGTNLPGDDPESDGGGGGGATISQLQNLAISQAEELGILTPVIQGDIMDMGYDELVSFIQYLQEQLSARLLGGSFQPGQPLLMGEGGVAEIAAFNGTGSIYALRDLLFRNAPPVGVGGQTNIDRSTNMGGFNFPDPRGIPPTYIRAMERIASNIVRRSWAGLT